MGARKRVGGVCELALFGAFRFDFQSAREREQPSLLVCRELVARVDGI